MELFFLKLIWHKVLWLNDWNKQICSKSGLVLAGPPLPLMAPCVAGAGFQFCHFPSVSHISARLIIACNERDKLIEEEGEKKKKAENADAGVEPPWLAAPGHMVALDARGSAEVLARRTTALGGFKHHGGFRRHIRLASAEPPLRTAFKFAQQPSSACWELWCCGAAVQQRSSVAFHFPTLSPPPPPPPLIQSHTVVRSLWNAAEVSPRCLHSEKYRNGLITLLSEYFLKCVCVHAKARPQTPFHFFFTKKNGKTPTRCYLCLVATKICGKLGYKSSRLQLKVKKGRKKEKKNNHAHANSSPSPPLPPSQQIRGRAAASSGKKKKKSTNRD